MWSLGVARSTLNTPRKQRARGGNKRNVVEAGEGLYARRQFKKQEVILDYLCLHERDTWGEGGSPNQRGAVAAISGTPGEPGRDWQINTCWK